MDDASGVRLVEGGREVIEDARDFRDGERAFGEPIGERAARHQGCIEDIAHHPAQSLKAQMVFVMEIGDQRFQARAKPARRFQTFGQWPLLQPLATGTAHCVLAGFNHHRLDFRQFGHLSPDHALRRLVEQISSARRARFHPHVDHFLRIVHQGAFRFGMPRFRPDFLAPLSLGPIGFPIPRGRLRRIVRGWQWLFKTLDFRFQTPDFLKQALDERNQFFPRQVAQDVHTRFGQHVMYNTQLSRKS